MAYDKAIKIDFNEKDDWNNKGVAFIILGNFEKVILACEESIKLDSKYTYGRYNKRIALGNLGKDLEAILAYEEAIIIEIRQVICFSEFREIFGSNI